MVCGNYGVGEYLLLHRYNEVLWFPEAAFCVMGGLLGARGRVFGLFGRLGRAVSGLVQNNPPIFMISDP